MTHGECNSGEMLVIAQTNAEEFSAYQTKLVESGYSLYTRNEIVDNKFVTFVNDKYVVNVSYVS
ncbi:MAG: hypothetical protein IKJ00_01105, partial [Clostridia bacterium]|nr:hypothetical protein [Clostridia bacterium]